MPSERCKGCYKAFKLYQDRIAGTNGEYHVTCWNQTGTKKAARRAAYKKAKKARESHAK